MSKAERKEEILWLLKRSLVLSSPFDVDDMRVFETLVGLAIREMEEFDE